METLLFHLSKYITCAFLPYLWGMETKYCSWIRNENSRVLTVPMRNGNHYIGGKTHMAKTSSYRTYEEWKLFLIWIICQFNTKFLPYLWGMETRCNHEVCFWEIWVLTVPMRNGNLALVVQVKLPTLVLTVPMRNGNFQFSWNASIPSIVLTVPMRNGNFLQSITFSVVQGCSYRTYEEWKRKYRIPSKQSILSSYRTYEEWKRSKTSFA